jgi:DNA-binding NarL/FixJ family response regulator
VPDVAYCRYREAEAFLLIGDRVSASASLAEAHTIAIRVGITPLVAEVEALARRARLELEAPTIAVDPAVTAEPVDPWGLSPREREDLTLVGEGRTNRQIGDALFISDKTASVHVTHILVKMGVSSRTEAALLAGRTGLTRYDTPVVATDD